VRVTWHASPADQKAIDDALRIRGVRDGEVLPAVLLAASDGTAIELAPSTLRLDASAAGLNPVTGRGWTERVLGLLERHGPFALAYLEALLRASDQRASRAPDDDPLLVGGGQ
jgi:CRISPR-associated endonuclease/helicase Cas3